MVDEELADLVWEAWDAGLIDDQIFVIALLLGANSDLDLCGFQVGTFRRVCDRSDSRCSRILLDLEFCVSGRDGRIYVDAGTVTALASDLPCLRGNIPEITVKRSRTRH